MINESAVRAASDHHPLLCALAFHANLAESRGTADMVGRLHKHGIPVQVIE
jgi:hypothetical protein